MKKFDWFLLAYTFKTAIGHGTGSLVKGFCLESGEKNITNSDITKLTEMAKESCSVKESFIDFYLISISYLGHMTEAEFFEEQSQ